MARGLACATNEVTARRSCNGYLIILLLLSTYRFVAYVIEQRLVVLLLPCVRLRWVLEMNFGSIDRYYVYIYIRERWLVSTTISHTPPGFGGQTFSQSAKPTLLWILYICSCCYYGLFVVVIVINLSSPNL